ncbi:MAG: tetratricopeptide repeat protein [Rhizobiaceae bacterium]|nr:tetratricopeptide repeat protein [Rhizobiaceae bacterium]
MLLSGTAGFAKEASQPVRINSFSGAFLAGRVAEVDNDLDDAIAYYKRGLAFDPDNQSMRQSLMLALISNGQFDEALPYAEKLKTVAEVERFSRVALAIDDIRKSRYSDAVNMLKLALSSDLDRLIAGLMTAWAQQGEGKPTEALATIDGLSGPEWFDLFKTYHRALIAEKAGMTKESDEAFDKIIANAMAGGAAPDTWLRAAEAYSGSLARRGEKARALETLDKAEQFVSGRVMINQLRAKIEKGTQVAPLITNTADGASEVLLDLGSALNRGGGEPFVRLYLRMALALRPDSDSALLQLAANAEQLEDSEAAIDLYRRIPKDSPVRRAADLQTGLNLADLDRNAEAEAALRKLVNSDPGDMRAYLALGGVLASQQKYAESAKVYDEAVAQLEKGASETRTDGGQTSNWNIYYQRGISYERLKEWPKAEPNFRKALELAPDQPQVLNYLGYSWVDMNMNLDEALGMIQKAVDLRPSDGYIVDSLGWAHYKLGDFDQAVSELERAVSLKPEDPVLNDHLGDAYWRVGRRLEATFQWSHARDLKPDADVLAQVEKKLSEGLPPVPEKATAEQPSVTPPPAVKPAEEPKEEQRTDAGSNELKAEPASYRVLPGQSLWSIADDVLGNGNRYLEILNLNPQLRNDPGRLLPGQELTLPTSN